MPEHRRRDVGIQIIVAYKAFKAVAEAALAVTLVVLAATGEIAVLRELAHRLRVDFTSHWALLLGRVLAALLSERGIHLLEIGMAGDALVSAFEGWCLWRGYRWAEWVVVAATAIPLPIEVIAIFRRFSPWRVAAVVVNVAVVAYLARRISGRRRPPAALHGEGPPPR